MEMKDKIKTLRQQNDLTLEQVGKAVGVGKSTVRKWESGDIANMRRDKIAKLAAVLHTTPAYLMGWDDEPEIDYTQYNEIIEIDNMLNSEGHMQWAKYGRILATQPEYKSEGKRPAAITPMQTIRHYLTPAAAGYVAPIAGDDYEDISLPMDAPKGADFCVDVAGDSMEPYIHDGSMVYVQRDVPLNEFDVGVFFLDGDVFIKQYAPSYDGSVYLLSANPNRQDANKIISKDATSTLACYGKVILPHKLPMPNYK